jgi:hypothetical protein
MKKYIIASMYHQGSQAFIQGGHASDELALSVIDGDYTGTPLGDLYIDWNKNHKTYVNLEMNDQLTLMELHDWIKENQDSLSIPIAFFKEPMLNDTVTAISFVAPTKLSVNLQFTVRNLKDHIKKVGNLNSFHNILQSFNYLCEVSGVKVDYCSKKEIFEFSYMQGEEKIEYSYNAVELDYFLKVRFIRMKI